MAFFVLLVVGIVVAQTWIDWNDRRLPAALPQWAGGIAVAGILAALLTGATSFASYWYEQSASENGTGISWLSIEIGFLLCAMGIVVAATRKKRLRILLILSAILTAILWIGLAIS